MNTTPERIVCLCAEAADWFWRIGAWDKVVGATAYFAQPPNAAPKPRVSGFDSVCFDDLEELKPDLVVTFSDVQAAITAELIRSGFNVIATNQRNWRRRKQPWHCSRDWSDASVKQKSRWRNSARNLRR